MKQILSSASKVVFVLMALAVVAGLFTNKVDQNNFMLLASAAFTYYFTRDKGTTPTI